MTTWRIAPIAVGVGLVIVAALTGSRSGLLDAAMAVLLGAIWPTRAAVVGALLAAPLVISAVVLAATHSAGWFAIAVVATPFVIATSALLAVGGSFVGHALGRGNESA